MTRRKDDWSVRIEFEGTPPQDQILQLADVLERSAGVVGGGVVGRSFAVTLSVKAASGIDAIRAAEAVARNGLARAGIDAQAPVIGHEAQTLDALVAADFGVSHDALVGLSEIARAHEFSRQRAFELSRHPTFPSPIATIGRSPVWRFVDVERWLAIPRPPGRPKGTVKQRATETPKSSSKKVAAAARRRRATKRARKRS